MSVTFPSKVDLKLSVIGFATPCVALVAIGTTVGRPLVLPLALVTASVAVIIVWTVLSTYYESAGGLLIAQSGPFSWRIPLKDISGVSESRSARSGPALSMDRLEIAWGEGKVLLVSPKDKAGFLALLHKRAPQLAAPEKIGASA